MYRQFGRCSNSIELINSPMILFNFYILHYSVYVLQIFIKQ